MKATVTVTVALAMALTAAATTVAAAAGERATAVRALTATARQFVRELPMPEVRAHAQRCGASGADGLARFSEQRLELCRRFDLSLSAGRPPSLRDLAKLRRWTGQLHGLGVEARLFPDGSEEDVRFSGSLALAQGYLDCAAVLADGAPSR
jgi:hypothetical protein